MAKTTKKHMSKQDIDDWEKLYEYVKCNVMGYDDNQSLSRNMVLRLKGLANNKFMANNNIKDTADYSYKIILLTFKYCNSSIQRALNNVAFKDESHKFNYILKIVEDNINTVYMRMKKKNKIKEEIESSSTNIAYDNKAEYKPKEKAKDKFSDLW